VPKHGTLDCQLAHMPEYLGEGAVRGTPQCLSINVLRFPNDPSGRNMPYETFPSTWEESLRCTGEAAKRLVKFFVSAPPQGPWKLLVHYDSKMYRREVVENAAERFCDLLAELTPDEPIRSRI